MPNSTNDPAALRKSRFFLVLIALVFAAPILVAGLLTFTGWQPSGKGNGQPIMPQRNFVDEKLRVRLANGQMYAWRDSEPRMTLIALPGPRCSVQCLDDLTAMAKARVMLSRNQSRLRLLYLGQPPAGEGLVAIQNYWQLGTDVDNKLASYRPARRTASARCWSNQTARRCRCILPAPIRLAWRVICRR
jgi:hypothetical protein